MRSDYLPDLRHALRASLHHPGHAALIVIILAVVIGATTAILTVVDAVLLRALPYPDADRLVLIWDTHAERGIPEMNLSLPKVHDLREQAASFDAIGVAIGGTSLILSGHAEPRRLAATLVSPELLRLTGVEPARGRLFADDENRVPGERRVALVSHDLWQGELGGDDGIVGRQLTLGNASYTVVGVMPRDFVDFPFPAQNIDVWVPAMMASEIYGVDMLTVRTTRSFVTLARLRPGATVEGALAELRGIDANLAAEYPAAEGGWAVKVESLRESFLGDLQPPLLGLAGGSILLLLIGCANATSLLLVRASRRQGEIATRLALGASRARLFVHATIESMIPALSGGALGTLVAAASIEALAARVPVEWPRYVQIRADLGVMLAALLLAALAGALAAMLSILPVLRAAASTVLPSQGRAVEVSGGTLRRGLVIAEVAVAVMLLVGAGLIAQSFARLRADDVGFVPDRLVAMQIDVPPDSYTPARLGVLVREIEQQVEAVASVAESYVWSPQIPGQSSWYTAVRPQDRPALRDDELPLVRFHYVGPGALEGIGLRFIAGRGISAEDTADGNGVIVLSESAARALWPEGDEPVGKIVRRWNRDRWLTVVGVTEDAKLSGRQGLGTQANLDVYFSYLQEPQSNIVVLAGTDGEPAGAVGATRAAVQSVVPGIPAFDADTMAAKLAEQETIPRFTAALAIGFAGTALFLASIGLYGVLTYSVSLRTREIGLRVALGARPGRILRDVMRHGVGLAAAGVVAGLAGALALTRWIEALLFEVSPADPATFAGAALLLLLVAASASLLPARRALRIEVQEALRTR